MNCYLGIDPGLNGAIALWSPDLDDLIVKDVPTLTLNPRKSKKREIDVQALANLMEFMCDKPTPTFAVMESVGTRPGQGAGQVLRTGWNAGVMYGAFAAHKIPHKLVTPAQWKRDLRVAADKDEARKRASMLMPEHAYLWARSKDDGRAEAALLARYAEYVHMQTGVGR